MAWRQIELAQCRHDPVALAQRSSRTVFITISALYGNSLPAPHSLLNALIGSQQLLQLIAPAARIFCRVCGGLHPGILSTSLSAVEHPPAQLRASVNMAAAATGEPVPAASDKPAQTPEKQPANDKTVEELEVQTSFVLECLLLQTDKDQQQQSCHPAQDYCIFAVDGAMYAPPQACMFRPLFAHTSFAWAPS